MKKEGGREGGREGWQGTVVVGDKDERSRKEGQRGGEGGKEDKEGRKSCSFLLILLYLREGRREGRRTRKEGRKEQLLLYACIFSSISSCLLHLID